jgi:uncharacterized protein YjiS (DUF1127 family)
MRFPYRIRHGMTIGETDGFRPLHHETRRRTAMPALVAPHARPVAGFAAAPLFAGFLARLRLWRRLRAERQSLARLDARLLRDIGLDAAAAAKEAARPFWDVPPGR